jgi:RimJ/RimL family protein N-acetyltransferase
MRTAIDFATYLGYFGMYVDTFTSNKAILRIIEKIGGFQKVGVLPVGGKLQGSHSTMSSIEFTHSNDKAREQFPSFFTGNRKTVTILNLHSELHF